MKDLEKPAHILEAETEAAAAAQSEAEIKNAIKRHQARMAMYADWVKPESIKERLEKHAKEAAAALEKAGPPRKTLPVPDPLPDYMKGQQPSTIQAWLRSGFKPEKP